MIIDGFSSGLGNFKNDQIIDVEGDDIIFNCCDFSKCRRLNAYSVRIRNNEDPIDMSSWEVKLLSIEDTVKILDFGNIEIAEFHYIDQLLIDAIEKSKIKKITFEVDFGYFEIRKHFDSVTLIGSEGPLPRFNTDRLNISYCSDLTIEYNVHTLSIECSDQISITGQISMLYCEECSIIGNIVVDVYDAVLTTVHGRIYAHEVIYDNTGIITTVVVKALHKVGPNIQLIQECDENIPGFRRIGYDLRRL